MFAAIRRGLVLREQLGRRSPAGLIFEIDIGKLLAVVVARDQARLQFLDRPGRREAARHRSFISEVSEGSVFS